MLKITVLTDNKPHPDNPRLHSEHGLSLYIEFGDRHILCDTGASDRFVENAARMGVALNVDICFISHGHNDHTGGLGHFLRFFPSTPIYLSRHLFDRKFSHHAAKREIGTDAALQQRYGNRFVYIDQSRWIAPDVAAVQNCCAIYPKPIGNGFLTEEYDGVETADRFEHELALALRTDKGLVVVSPCSHGGAINIIESCRLFTGEEKVYAFVGGFHFVDEDDAAQETAWFREDVDALYPGIKIYTGHCTGEIAQESLLEAGSDAQVFHTGSVIEL